MNETSSVTKWVVAGVSIGALGLAYTAGAYFSPGLFHPQQAPSTQTVPTVPQPPGTVVQGVTPAERQVFYHLAEGSELFPLDWLRALNSSVTKRPFMEDLERFGFLPDPDNRDGLPIGMTAAESRDIRFARMVGVNCAACHVNQLTYQGKLVFTTAAGKSVPVLGAPSLFDIGGFLGELVASVLALQDPGELFAFLVRWGRQHLPFAADAAPTTGALPSLRVMASAYPDLSALEKIGGLDKGIAEQFKREVQAGWKRPAADLTPKLKAEFQPKLPAANQFKLMVPEVVQADWKPLLELKPGKDSPLAALGADSPLAASLVPGWFSETREIIRLLKARAEFLGKLAGTAQVKNTPAGTGRTDAFGNARNLIFGNPPIETTAPVSYPHLWGFARAMWLHWDGNMDSVMERNIGQALGLGAIYNSTTFESTVLPRNIHQLELIARKIEPPAWPEAVFGKLDPVKVKRGGEVFKDACAKCHPPLPAAGVVDNFPQFDLKEIGTDSRRALNFAEPLGKEVFSDTLGVALGKIKQQVYQADQIDAALAQQMEMGRLPPRYRTTRQYVGRPLVAIWATAPYLHNNSVPTLADLLEPTNRPPKFTLKGREYDPAKGGYVVDLGGTPQFDTTLPGNSNQGHEYGAALSAPDKLALLEYLKAN